MLQIRQTFISLYQSFFDHTGGSIFALDKLIIPVNITKLHWFAIVVDFRGKTITAYDSLPEDNTTGQDAYLSKVEKYLLGVEKRKEGQPDTYYGEGIIMPEGKWKRIPCKKGSGLAPRQVKGSNDCGVHLCLFMDLVMKDMEPRLLIDSTVNVTRFGRYALCRAICMNKPIFGANLLKNDKPDVNS